MLPQTVRRVSIPIANSPVPRSAGAPVILVVTPDTNLREVSERVLAREGYRVLSAAHAGHAVLACLKAGRVDVLAVELSMDDMSGPALADAGTRCATRSSSPTPAKSRSRPTE